MWKKWKRALRIRRLRKEARDALLAYRKMAARMLHDNCNSLEAYDSYATLVGLRDRYNNAMEELVKIAEDDPGALVFMPRRIP